MAQLSPYEVVVNGMTTTLLLSDADAKKRRLTKKASTGSASPDAFDPAAHSAEEVVAYLEQADDAERERVLAAERSGKARKTVLGDS